MKFTEEQHLEIIEHNINQAKEICRKASAVNAGRYIHCINETRNELQHHIKKYTLKQLRAKKDVFQRICGLKTKLAANLYMLENNI